jgi:cytoskeletal protein CcmA (bactofilin family)
MFGRSKTDIPGVSPAALPRGERRRSVLQGITITGDLSSDGIVDFDGTLIGDLTADTLVLARSGRIEGNIRANSRGRFRPATSP